MGILVSIDVESDGPAPGLYSMISFGAIIVEEKLNRTFYAKIKPISNQWIPEALAISGFTREQTLSDEFLPPEIIMARFETWILRNNSYDGRPIMFSDNSSYDFAFINYYFRCYLRRNPFGYSSRNINDLYKGMMKDTSVNFHHLRKTIHSHDPLDDARGNAEALLSMEKMGLKLRKE